MQPLHTIIKYISEVLPLLEGMDYLDTEFLIMPSLAVLLIKKIAKDMSVCCREANHYSNRKKALHLIMS